MADDDALVAELRLIRQSIQSIGTRVGMVEDHVIERLNVIEGKVDGLRDAHAARDRHIDELTHVRMAGANGGG